MCALCLSTDLVGHEPTRSAFAILSSDPVLGLCCSCQAGDYVLDGMRWGLVPSYTKAVSREEAFKHSYRMINARYPSSPANFPDFHVPGPVFVWIGSRLVSRRGRKPADILPPALSQIGQPRTSAQASPGSQAMRRGESFI